MLLFDSHKKQKVSVRMSLIHAVLITICIAISSCKKLVEIPPPTQSLAENNVYTTDASAIGVLNGLYISQNSDGPFQGLMSIGLLAGLSADELTMFATTDPYYTYYQNKLSGSIASTSYGFELWAPLFKNIYKCNAAIEGLQNSESLTPSIKMQLLGEAKFMRAFIYFYLVNLFGDVPLVLSTDAEGNAMLPRSSKNDVYLQIITDLNDAKDMLSSNFLDASLLKITNERVRPTKWAATALLARAYLYTNKFDSAELNSTEVISNVLVFDTVSLSKAFLKNSKEAIWQLQPTTNNLNTRDGRMFIIPSTGPSSSANPVFLSKILRNSFEQDDKRAALGNWIDRMIYKKTTTTNDTAYFVFKYKVSTSTGVTTTAAMSEYLMVLRIAEQYLIRAEARAQQNNIGGAKADLNLIRLRAGLPNTTTSTKDDLLTEILNEKRHELFAEWGHRWLDLKRTGKVDDVMSIITPLKANGAPWESYQQLYPINRNELNKAQNLTQTPGYN